MDYLIRFFLGGGTVALSGVIAKLAGGRIGGLFAAFPAVYLSAAITAAAIGVGSAQGADQVMSVSKGALIGMIANIPCAIAASVYIRRFGLWKGLIYAIALWLILAPAAFFTGLKLGLIK